MIQTNLKKGWTPEGPQEDGDEEALPARDEVVRSKFGSRRERSRGERPDAS